MNQIDEENLTQEEWLLKFKDDNGQFKYCEVCGQTPSAFAPCGLDVFKLGRKQYKPSVVSNKLIRKACYKDFVYFKYGLGKGNRIEIPGCVLEHIRNQWPDASDDYMGHHDS